MSNKNISGNLFDLKILNSFSYFASPIWGFLCLNIFDFKPINTPADKTIYHPNNY
ncbi:MAG: hypothetical protein Ct9H90mP3_2220 [Flammeovirgaceae bacterium]|nr:MAG: hypothetical protein Ct9H90mP3_2220 [Flammeovirgaceae bacterium]